MRRTFIINGERIELEVEYIRFRAKLDDITPVGTFWSEKINAGDNRLELKGKSTDGREVSGVFRILSSQEENVLEIEPWTDHPSVGGGI